ncbi:hypothetical protein [Streptomyces spectabilis]|uniref:Uncharacterized protein n=1 Tax=Streptomyces spectabilis TaxID=68270 RepID=A0A7W8APA5_STRST|nr:hypothetical protein [Streptomyces spectabilis]MBB5102106.1 hypothetical protein [Streptomyces spectabilis]MCI3907156.1 hypothetical protein [Streptomyces spectabilis]GGV28802.1 hypothetical protein GCM10010245_46810 [Streptomyces spectabilis]
MTARTGKREVLRLYETGWAKARRLRGRGVRTCLAPVPDGSAQLAPPVDPDGNVVRGED